MERKKLIPATTMRQHMLAGISDMTLHRWLGREELKFPRPVYIGKRRYWREAEVLEWIDAQAERGAA